jgi:hypothetical protein
VNILPFSPNHDPAPFDPEAWARALHALFMQYTHEDWVALATRVPTSALEARALDCALAFFARLMAQQQGPDVGRWSRKGTLPVQCIAPRFQVLTGGR